MALRRLGSRVLSGWRSALLGVLVCSSMAQAGTTLMLFGGGLYTEKAMKAFVESAGRSTGTIAVITWGSEFPNAYFSDFVEAVKQNAAPADLPKIEHAPTFEMIAEKKEEFLTLIDKASAVFFTGGDQERIMKVLLGQPELMAKIQSAFRSGVVIGGKSAGTAIASEVMIAGGEELRRIDAEKVSIGKGTGWLKELVIDQHFVARQREKRLKSAMLRTNTHVGIGIDEDNAVIVHDEHLLEPIGPGDLSIYRRLDKGMTFREDVVVQGLYFDLKANSLFRRADSGELARVITASEM